ncbi:hypothetical protein VTK73DRAFT_10313 [Phialemonium thermophilum]|uniref:N2227-like protein n=1 Tax=Phialemonium thermophilum TaxID=223376 RepID=A0ABR3XG78_9PEZI
MSPLSGKYTATTAGTCKMKSCMLLARLAVLLSGILLSCTAAHGSAYGFVDPYMPVYELHNVLVTVQQDTNASTPRIDAEKARLLERMKKTVGKYDEHHPRHRLLQALHGFRRYRETHMAEVQRLRGLYKHVSKKQKQVLEKTLQYSAKFDEIEELLRHNAVLCEDIVRSALAYYEVEEAELQDFIRETEATGRVAEKVSVSQALKHYVRDWAEEGAVERDPGYTCVSDILKNLPLPSPASRSDQLQVLVPGAGLGRLAHDIARLGYNVTSNEWSMYMNVAYRFLEASRAPPRAHTVHPFVDNWSHHARAEDMLRGVAIPDVSFNRTAVLLVEGDFTTVLGRDRSGQYDVVITYFFIDTARNLMSYLDTIHRVLRRGGYWINFGPLLYGSAPFVQLALDEIVDVSRALGFSFVETPMSCGELTFEGLPVRGMESVYGFDDRALIKNAYQAQALRRKDKDAQGKEEVTLAECSAVLKRISNQKIYREKLEHASLTIAPEIATLDNSSAFIKRLGPQRHAINNSYCVCRVRKDRLTAIFLERLDQALTQQTATPPFARPDKDGIRQQADLGGRAPALTGSRIQHQSGQHHGQGQHAADG